MWRGEPLGNTEPHIPTERLQIMGASVNFHTKTYLGSLRKVRKYAKALREELGEAVENMSNKHGYLHEALKELTPKAHELYLTAGDYEMMRDADLYIARREGMEAMEEVRKNRINELTSLYISIANKRQTALNNYSA
jgi:hypothetical protein